MCPIHRIDTSAITPKIPNIFRREMGAATNRLRGRGANERFFGEQNKGPCAVIPTVIFQGDHALLTPAER